MTPPQTPGADIRAQNTPSAALADLSVVVLPLLGGDALSACVRELQRQGATIIIVPASGDVCRFDGVEVLTPPMGHESVPGRRLAGLKAARTPFVAFIEDTCVPGPHWCDALSAGFAEGELAAIGGPVEISPALPPQQRALGITEYARFQAVALARRTGGLANRPVQVSSLPGANFAVRRSALAEIDAAAMMIDNAMFPRILAAGGIVSLPDAYVTYCGRDVQGARLSTRFHHGRIFGGGRSANKSAAVRVLLAMAALAIPALLFSRSCRDAPRWVWRTPATLVWILLMHTAWALGECLGAATGRVGDSLKRWA